MKDQYVGDVNDYRKYGLLRGLAAGEHPVRVGVCWLLTPDDGGTDGVHTRYLGAPERWRSFDPVLFDLLSACVHGGNRTVSYVEESGVIPNAVFHSDVVTDRAAERRRYCADARRRLDGVDLVFFDPDNGLEVASCAYGRKRSSKYLYWHELSDTYAAGHSVLVYQHFAREKRELFLDRIAGEIASRLAADDVLAFRTPRVAFFLASQPEHTELFRTRAAAVVDRWEEGGIRLHSGPHNVLDTQA